MDGADLAMLRKLGSVQEGIATRWRDRQGGVHDRVEFIVASVIIFTPFYREIRPLFIIR